jgi:hypothetical protein
MDDFAKKNFFYTKYEQKKFKVFYISINFKIFKNLNVKKEEFY